MGAYVLDAQGSKHNACVHSSDMPASVQQRSLWLERIPSAKRLYDCLLVDLVDRYIVCGTVFADHLTFFSCRSFYHELSILV
jgi:uncharacterized lipoprotein YddW (UPF0748 family)